MRLVHYSYIFFVILLMLLDDIQVEGISFPPSVGATYFGAESRVGLYAEDKCHKAAHQKYDTPCYIAEGEAFLCDHKEFLRCSNGTCVCFRGYRYNSIIEKCEPDRSEQTMRRKREPDHSEYLMRQKREPGKALPGETCHLSGNCVVGLYCINDVCKCPDPCKYEREEGICDCGRVDLDFPKSAMALTIILSLLSVAIWGFVIRRTYKAGKKRNTQSNDDENVDENRPLEMNHLNEPGKPEYGGQDNFQAPSYPPPPYNIMDERKDCAPFYPPGEVPAPDIAGWKVTPMPGPPNTTTNLTSESQVEALLPFGATSGSGNPPNYGISSSSVVSPENVTPVITSKSQEDYLPYSLPPQHASSFSDPSIGTPPTASSCTNQQNTSEVASLPYSINPQNMPSTLPPPPSAEVSPTTPYTSGSPTAPPYKTGSPTAPPYTTGSSTAPPYTTGSSTAPSYTTGSSTAPSYTTDSSTAPPPYTAWN